MMKAIIARVMPPANVKKTARFFFIIPLFYFALLNNSLFSKPTGIIL